MWNYQTKWLNNKSLQNRLLFKKSMIRLKIYQNLVIIKNNNKMKVKNWSKFKFSCKKRKEKWEKWKSCYSIMSKR